jgi:hypothetical protein
VPASPGQPRRGLWARSSTPTRATSALHRSGGRAVRDRDRHPTWRAAPALGCAMTADASSPLVFYPRDRFSTRDGCGSGSCEELARRAGSRRAAPSESVLVRIPHTVRVPTGELRDESAGSRGAIVAAIQLDRRVGCARRRGRRGEAGTLRRRGSAPAGYRGGWLARSAGHPPDRSASERRRARAGCTGRSRGRGTPCAASYRRGGGASRYSDVLPCSRQGVEVAARSRISRRSRPTTWISDFGSRGVDGELDADAIRDRWDAFARVWHGRCREGQVQRWSSPPDPVARGPCCAPSRYLRRAGIAFGDAPM